jgi:hypothetical protein
MGMARSNNGAARKLTLVEKPEFEITDIEELARQRDNLDPTDPHFKSELDYEGYQSIEESDNNAFNSLHAERSWGPVGEELTIEDREEDPEMGEENPVDPQENQK